MVLPYDRPSRSRRLAIGSVGVVGATALLAGCAFGGGPVATDNGPASTTLPDEDVTLTLWTVQPATSQAALKEVIAAYESEHPTVTIDLNYSDNESFVKTFKLVMSSDSAPDITECGQGYTQQAPLVEAGLIRPLDDYAELYDWESLIPSGFLDQARLNDEGSSFGAGTLYGLPVSGNMIGIYYNVSKLQELGIDPAFATLAEFEDALQVAEDAGEVPLMMGNQDGDPGAKAWEPVYSAYSATTDKQDWVYGADGADIVTDGGLAATEKLSEWIDAGYFYEGANGTGRDDGVSKFASGEGVFMLQGSWYLATLDEGMGDDLGYTRFPELSADDSPRASGATSQPWCISSQSPNADAAASFLDFLAQPAQAPTLLDGGFMPIQTEGLSGTSTAEDQALDAWRELVDSDGLTLASDWATPSMQGTLNPGLQELYAQRTTAEKLMTDVQANWAEFQGSK